LDVVRFGKRRAFEGIEPSVMRPIAPCLMSKAFR
jgi:hypothetical protein